MYVYVYILTSLTFPDAAVNLDPHADGARMLAVGDEAHAACDEGQVELLPFRQVRVAVATQYLRNFKRRSRRQSAIFLCCVYRGVACGYILAKKEKKRNVFRLIILVLIKCVVFIVVGRCLG